MESYDYLFKIVLIGDSGVGKTNLLSQLTRGEFSAETKATIGVEFATKTFKIDNLVIKAQIWDTAGQERYRAITSAYYRGTLGALIVYDITRKSTLSNATKHWLTQLKEYSGEEIEIMMVGNKTDLEDERTVTVACGNDAAKSNNLNFLETSALDGSNVEKAFDELIKAVYRRRKTLDPEFKEALSRTEPAKNKKIIQIKKKKKKSCC